MDKLPIGAKQEEKELKEKMIYSMPTGKKEKKKFELNKISFFFF